LSGSFVSRALATVVLAVAFFAGLHTAEARKGKARAPKADAVDCKKDSDCVVVVDECCPCSQGGKQRAIPKKQKDTYEKDRKKGCKDTACTEMVSTDPTCTQVAICAAGICELNDAPAAAP
jgi:hypothetical protein